VKILYFGTSTFAIPALQALLARGEQVVAVVTQPDRPAGRGGRLTPPAVKVAADAAGVPVLQPESCRTPEFLEVARHYAPDLSVVAAYGQFLPDPLRTLPSLGTVNLHGSLLPRYRGAAPIQRALWNGDTITGVCLMWMVRAMDAGDVIACAETPIMPEDTGGSLSERLSMLAADLLVTWLPALADGTAPHLPQDSTLVTLAPVIRKEERVVDWTQPAEAIWRQIRALAPTPAAMTLFREQPLKLLAAWPLEGSGTPGAILSDDPRIGLRVGTGDGVLELREVQPAGKRPMSGADFLRGTRLAPDEGFMSPAS
jgi:methionyl-tRNA formyltransferase